MPSSSDDIKGRDAVLGLGSDVLVIRILDSNIQLSADPVDNEIGDVVRPIWQTRKRHSQVRHILGIVHIGSNLHLQEGFLRLVEDQRHRILRFQVIVND